MKGISDVIAVTMILMITVALASLGYIFFTGTFSSLTNITQASVNQTTTGLLSQFNIESVSGTQTYQIFIRNTGSSSLSNFSVYVNDIPVQSTPLTLNPGQLGYTTITFIGAGSKTIRVTSSSGYEASKTYTFDPYCGYSGVLACYHFDEGTGLIASDNTGNNYNGMLTNNPVWVAGKIGNAINFNNPSAYVQVPSVIVGSSWTMAAWIMFPLPVTTSGWRTLFQNGANHHHVLVDVNGNLGTYMNGFYSSGYNVNSLSGWHYLVAVGNTGTTRFFIDGRFVGTSNFEETLPLNYIGNYVGGGQNFGIVDEVRIFNRALSDSEVSSISS